MYMLVLNTELWHLALFSSIWWRIAGHRSPPKASQPGWHTIVKVWSYRRSLPTSAKHGCSVLLVIYMRMQLPLILAIGCQIECTCILQLLPAERQRACRHLLKEYYQSLTKHLVKDHRDLRNMEKLNRKILQVGTMCDAFSLKTSY